MNPRIYLDHAATTPLDPRVLDAMTPFYTHHYGNPSSNHQIGRDALQSLNRSRETIATVFNATAQEIIFTSGGTEANNLAIRGVAIAQQRNGHGNHIITSSIEHHSVLHTMEDMRHMGFDVTLVPVDQRGLVKREDVQSALRPDTVLVSIMYANNEIGTIQPIADLGSLCREHGVIFHTDAVQAASFLVSNVSELPIDLLTISAHKMYGPKGVGVLYVRQGTPLVPHSTGGQQERHRRAGTENVPGIVGCAAALQHIAEHREEYGRHCTLLRDQLIDGILDRIPGSRLNGDRHQRLPNNVNVSFDGVDSESLILMLDQHGICASSGSACTSGSPSPSHVLMALGLSYEQAHNALRLTVGKEVTVEHIDRALDVLSLVIEQLRGM